MKLRSCMLCVSALLLATCATASAERYRLLTGVDARHYPGLDRTVSPSGSGVPGTFNDGDRLAGTSDVSTQTVPFYGLGTPMFQPNEFGSLSLLFRRGSVPLGPSGQLPFMGIEFLGGPRLDLDGDLDNGARSLVPVPEATPVVIPDSYSYVALEVDLNDNAVSLLHADITGNNEGGPGISAGTATILVTLAGTTPTGEPGEPINPGIDTRVGSAMPFGGNSGTLAGVYRIEDLGYELWEEDSIDPTTSTAAELGTMQFLGTFDGWLIERDPATGAFPTLVGEGLGSTLWPLVDTSQVGQTFNAATGSSPTATIADGVANDLFTAPGNGGLALTDFAGDLGAYLDAVVVPLVPPTSARFVYLESAGCGINNSNDPVYVDSVGYDVVLIAAEDTCFGMWPGDSNCDGAVNTFDIDPFVLALTDASAWQAQYGTNCDYLCVNDANGDSSVNTFDIDPFVALLVGQP